MFHRFRWKLTLSYTVTTVAALLVAEILAAFLLLLFLTSSWLPSLVLRQMEEDLVSRIRPYLTQPAPDVEGLRTWLRQWYAGGLAVAPESQPSLRVGGMGLDARLFVLDQDGRVLGALPDDDAAWEGESQLWQQPEVRIHLQNIQTGNVPPRPLRVRTSQGTDVWVLAAPIWDQANESKGVVVIAMPAFTVQDLRQLPLFSLMLWSAVLLLPVTAFFGVVFGWLMGRGLTHRLQHMSAVVAAWGQGNFAETIRENPPDELGQLAHRLNNMAAELEGLIQARELLAVVEERHRLARDLHDSVKQHVFSTSMLLSAARTLRSHDPNTAWQKVDEAFDSLKMIQEELKGLIYELRPLELEGQSLAQALRGFASRWTRQTGITLEVNVEEIKLPGHVEHALLRVAQEALTNVARHSKATNATLSLQRTPQGVLLAVSDNGVGFNPNRVSGGMGLHSMSERVQQIGGMFHLQSNHTGTTVEVHIPNTVLNNGKGPDSYDHSAHC